MPYADKEKQKAYMRDWSRNFQRRKTARLKELEARFQKQSQEQTEQIEDAFKPNLPPDPEKEMLMQEKESWKHKFLELQELCMLQEILLLNSELRNDVLALLLTNSSLARKR